MVWEIKANKHGKPSGWIDINGISVRKGNRYFKAALKKLPKEEQKSLALAILNDEVTRSEKRKTTQKQKRETKWVDKMKQTESAPFETPARFTRRVEQRSEKSVSPRLQRGELDDRIEQLTEKFFDEGEHDDD